MLLCELQAQVKKLFVYVVLREEDKRLEFDLDGAREYCESVSGIFMRPYELSGLDGIQATEIITKSIQLRAEEISLMMSENVQGIGDILEEIKDKLGAIEVIKGIDNAVLKAIMEKTEGNAMMLLEFVLILIESKYLKIANGMLTSTSDFKKAAKHDNWTSIPAPDFAHQLNSHYFSKLNSMYST